MFRSQQMQHHQLIMPRESAWEVINGLGLLGCVQIIDPDPTLPQISRPFANYVKRCDDLLQQLASITKALLEAKCPIVTNVSSESVMQYFQQLVEESGKPGHTYLDDQEKFINSRFEDIVHQTSILSKLKEQLQTNQYETKSLQQAEKLLGRAFFVEQKDVTLQPRLGFISKSILLQFERMVFRITRGHAYLHIQDFDDDKSLFVLLSMSPTINEKLIKLCSNMAIMQFELPQNSERYSSQIRESQRKVEELKNVFIPQKEKLIHLTEETLNNSLQQFLVVQPSGCSLIEQLRLFVLRERELYLQLSRLKMQASLFVGELWIPQEKVNDVERFLQRLNRSDRPCGQLQLGKKDEQPPTYIKTNSFTAFTQEIVDTYGIPRYLEFNPGIITCITFPFLFGVMFGDIFHGACLFLIGVYLIFTSQPVLQQFKPLKYMVTLMGFFAFYNGMIYNDFAGISLNLFGSCYEQEKRRCVYPFGIDPAWTGQLAFSNSMKMKLSVIIAYMHMTLGLILMGLNHKFQKVSLFKKFIPQMLFLSCTFGYMDLLIIIKWLSVFDTSSDAPSIINTMISMVLKLGAVEGTQLYQGQENVQLFLLVVATICIPWMWLPSIMEALANTPKNYLFIEQDSPRNLDHIEIEMADMQQLIPESYPLNHQPEQLDEVLIHETIETIEFILGCVSNTASYLRLWALSLAHSQLAEVFYDLLLAGPVEEASVVGLVVRYPLWAMATVGVLLCMDSMECFLHALRLHWVEFQNKFFKGDGFQFMPFCYAKLN